jgi:hypothetical protein
VQSSSPPAAGAKDYAVQAGATLTVAAAAGVLSSAGDAGCASAAGLTASLGKGPAHGKLALAADGSFTYTPDASYKGTDSFEFVVTAGKLSSTATATITVGGWAAAGGLRGRERRGRVARVTPCRKPLAPQPALLRFLLRPAAPLPPLPADVFTTPKNTVLFLTPEMLAPVLTGVSGAPAQDADVAGQPQSGKGSVAPLASGGLAYTPPFKATGTASFQVTPKGGGGSVPIAVNVVGESAPAQARANASAGREGAGRAAASLTIASLPCPWQPALTRPLPPYHPLAPTPPQTTSPSSAAPASRAST